MRIETELSTLQIGIDGSILRVRTMTRARREVPPPLTRATVVEGECRDGQEDALTLSGEAI